MRATEISAIEISVDFFAKKNTDQSLTDYATTLYRYHAALVSDNRRIPGPKGSKGQTRAPKNAIEVHQALSLGFPIEIGSTNDPISQRVYVKTTDHGGIALGKDKHSARVEVTIKSHALPFKSMAEWVNFDYATLAKFFKWRTPAHGARSMQVRKAQEVLAQIGSRKPTRGRRTTAPHTVANTALNERVYDALRSLTRRHLKSVRLTNFPAHPAQRGNDKLLINKGFQPYQQPHCKYLIHNK